MDTRPSMDDQFLTLINQIIEDNLADEHFSVEDLAEKAGLSRSMLHRRLAKITGKSATDLITEIRLTHAIKLLEDDTGTASEIAYQVGFGSPSYFHKVFKKHFGVSPGDVRKGADVHLHTSQTDRIIKSKKSALVSNARLRVMAIVILGIAVITIGVLFYLSRNERPVERSIAILPFDNLSPDEENQYFADGIVEDLLDRLSVIKDLKVISRTSSEMFRDKGNKSIPEIAGILGVSYILEGSLRRESDNIRISVQLIDAKKDDHIFAQQYDRNIGEVFKIQGEIAGQIANELSIYLSDHQLIEIKRNPTDNLDAFNYYQMAIYLSRAGRRNDYYASIEYYRKAIRADSNYALAYAGLAGAYCQMSSMGRGWIEDPESGKDSTIKLVLKALDIDENLAEAHVVLGKYHRNFNYNYNAAEKEYLKAIELGNIGHMSYAGLLMITGRPEKAREYIDKAIVLDPVSFGTRFGSALHYLTAQNYSKSLEEIDICLELFPDHYMALEINCICNFELGNKKAAYESLRNVGPLFRTFLNNQAAGYTLEQADSAYRASGMEGLIKFHMQKMGGYSRKALFYVVLGEYEKAIDMLELLNNQGELRPSQLFYYYAKKLEPYPRYKALKKNFGLDKY